MTGDDDKMQAQATGPVAAMDANAREQRDMQMIFDLRSQLEASQASEARLREALEEIWMMYVGTCAVLHGYEPPDLARQIKDTALNATEPNPVTAVVEAARAWVREEPDVTTSEQRLIDALEALDG